MTSSARGSRRPMRSGMTLIEMLVATAATLILMGAVTQVFSVFSSAVSNSRSMIEQDGRLRSVAWRLRGDLAGATARMLPPLKPEAGEGYFEIIEGPQSDLAATDGTTLLAADIDDVLLFTTQSSEAAFIGKAGSLMVESPTAEVAWFLRQTAGTSNPTTYTLFRRQLLVVGYAGFLPFSTQGSSASCWAALKRCTSSMNRIVRRPWCSSRSRAASTSLRRSFTPASTALRLLLFGGRIAPGGTGAAGRGAGCMRCFRWN